MIKFELIIQKIREKLRFLRTTSQTVFVAYLNMIFLNTCMYTYTVLWVNFPQLLCIILVNINVAIIKLPNITKLRVWLTQYFVNLLSNKILWSSFCKMKSVWFEISTTISAKREFGGFVQKWAGSYVRSEINPHPY